MSERDLNNPMVRRALSVKPMEDVRVLPPDRHTAKMRKARDELIAISREIIKDGWSRQNRRSIEQFIKDYE